uniref:Uncharacterized protein n=1 Tax=Meloidogyne enterolobii TaxID=390850 RepID=A0A6V7W8S2_MELEN|nr:unnamed protein product [Meloidogyne enterolobii]
MMADLWLFKERVFYCFPTLDTKSFKKHRLVHLTITPVDLTDAASGAIKK